MSNCQQLYHVCNKLLARAVIACLPNSSLQSLQQIVVTARNKSQAMQKPLISITGIYALCNLPVLVHPCAGNAYSACTWPACMHTKPLAMPPLKRKHSVSTIVAVYMQSALHHRPAHQIACALLLQFLIQGLHYLMTSRYIWNHLY